MREESVASFYVGCVPAICSTAASGAIFYGVYDLLKEDHLRQVFLDHLAHLHEYSPLLTLHTNQTKQISHDADSSSEVL